MDITAIAWIEAEFPAGCNENFSQVLTDKSQYGVPEQDSVLGPALDASANSSRGVTHPRNKWLALALQPKHRWCRPPRYVVLAG